MDNLIAYIEGMHFDPYSLEDMSLYESNVNKTPFSDKQLTVDLVDVEDFIKKNDVQEVTNPVFFVREGVPSPDGLLSNTIFGITKEERAGIWAYIDLHGRFLHPLVYKLWKRMDNAIGHIVHGTKTYKIDQDGYLYADAEGETGLDFLYKNIKKIKIKETDSYDRKKNIQFIYKNIDKIFITKMLVQPAFYRDVLSNEGRVEVGQLNKYYSSLLISARAVSETQELGFSLGEATKGRIQETLLSIYKCITGTSDDPNDGVGLSGKLGILNFSGLAKTVDYGTRLVLSAPELKVESLEDLMTDTEYCALPLASAIINFKPFVVFNVKRFFENEYGGGTSIPAINKEGHIVNTFVKDLQLTFSDQRIEEEIKKFVYGFSDRLSPVILPLEDMNGESMGEGYAIFKGRSISPEQYKNQDTAGASSLIDRPLTWCDVLYMAAVEAVHDKHVLVTRYPIDSAYNQIPQKVHISTIKETEHINVYGKYYKWYPKIRKEDISSNTSNKFIDTLNICNLLLGGMKADYDGDTVSIKGVWFQESNAELDKFLKSKSHYINFSGSNFREPTNEAVQSLYNMTLILDQDKAKLTNPEF